ncbi:unnamed protein product [Prunus armeniaca]
MGLDLLGCVMGFGGLQRSGFGGEQRWVLRWQRDGVCGGGCCKSDRVCDGVCLQEEGIFDGVGLDIRWGGV